MTYEEYNEKQKALNPDYNPVVDQAIAYARSAGYQPEAVNPTTPLPSAEQPIAPEPNVQPSATEAPNNPTAEFRKQDDEEWNKVMAGQQRLVDYWVGQKNQQDARIKAAEEENARRTQMENRRNALVGAGELAASLFNLYAVGDLHASNQVYKDFSQDWMRKADADRKMRLARIENLRERQRGIGDKLEGLKAAQTQDAYNRWRQQAAADAAAKEAEIERQRKAQEKEDAETAAMLAKGFRRDDADPSGFRYDPELVKEMTAARSMRNVVGGGSSAPKGSSGKTTSQQPYGAYRTSPQASSTPTQTGYVAPAESAPSVATSPTQGGAKKVNTAPRPAQGAATKPAQTSGSGKKRGTGRSTFLPPEQDVWERDIDLRKSPQGRKKVTPEINTGKTNNYDWSQYKVK